MKYFLTILFFSIVTVNVIYSQSIIKGTVIDDKGEKLIGVIVMLKSSSSVATSTDMDGAYTLKLASNTIQVVSISYIGFQTIIDTLFLKKGEERVKNYNLTPESFQIQDVQVLGRAKKSDDKYMESVKAKSVSTIDFISSATMKRTGDANVAAAVGRVSGVSTSGSIISVRGIGDRYVKTAINGLMIPTLDPFTNNIKLDLFPSSLVDNIVLTKTPTSDLPGDWAGAYISIETKDYPDKLMVNVESSFGYNNQSTFKNIISSERSSTDWLGYDDGMRNYNHSSFVGTSNPTNYDQFVALGLGDYFKSQGISNSNWEKNPDLFEKMGLIQLGILDKSKINDDNAFKLAKNEYEKNYYNKAFDIVNEKAAKSNVSFRDNWASTLRKAPLNTSQSISIGNQTILFGRTLGYLAGFKYTSSMQYDPNSTKSRIGIFEGKQTINDSAYQKVSKETNGWSGLFNLNYKMSKNHSFSVLFMPNIIGVNNVKDVKSIAMDNNQINYGTGIFYEERKQLIYQYKSEHYIPGPNLKINCNVSYTKGNSSAPDFKGSSFKLDSLQNKTQVTGGNRIFRYLSENIFDSKIQCELPLFKNSEIARKLRFGGSFQRNDRTSEQYSYYNSYDPDYLHNKAFPTSLDNYRITNITQNGIDRHVFPASYISNSSPLMNSIGYSFVQGGFVMIDYSFTKRLRASAGMRYERAYIYSDVQLFDSLKLDNTDKRRYSGPDVSNNYGELDKTSYLPAFALVYKLRNNDEAPLNLKVNFAQTIARPSIRELSDVSFVDYEFGKVVNGNPYLKMVQINNYDLRLEYVTKQKDNVSINLFYKDFKNHIELIDLGADVGYTWINNDKKSWLKGVELEGKKMIFKNLEFRANVTFVNSQSTLVPIYKGKNLGDTIVHTMYGQAPYVVNGILTYSSDTLKLSMSLSYNIQGSKLVISGTSLADVYERPRHLLDFKITKSLGKHFSTSFTVKDILNTAIRRTYKYNGKWLNDYDVYHWGTFYNVAVSYKL